MPEAIVTIKLNELLFAVLLDALNQDGEEYPILDQITRDMIKVAPAFIVNLAMNDGGEKPLVALALKEVEIIALQNLFPPKTIVGVTLQRAMDELNVYNQLQDIGADE